MKPNKKRKQGGKYKHQWGKSFFQDLDRVCGGRGNEGDRKK